MRLFYRRDAHGNFGDALNEWIWPRLLPGLLSEDASDLLVGIGTILDRRVPIGVQKTVLGSGTGIGVLPDLDQTWKLVCVRGPLTAQAIGAPPDLAVTDPAMLVADLFPHAPGQRPSGVAVMPHMFTVDRLGRRGIRLAQIVRDLGFRYLDPYRPVDETLRALASSKVVLAEAMHGAIVADALRVPWIPIQLMPEINPFKWWDWCSSLGLSYQPEVFADDPELSAVPTLARYFERVSQERRPTLSADAALKRATDRLYERLAHLKARCDGPCCPRGGTDFRADPSVLAEFGGPYQVNATVRELRAVTPLDERVILVNDDFWGPEILGERRPLPFLEDDGEPWGPPADDAEAIAELERMRRAGASTIAFVSTAFWWLEHYTEFHAYLRRSFPCIAESARVVAFDLRADAAHGA
jgi:hypothetical protein